jgi:hypothetical protein
MAEETAIAWRVLPRLVKGISIAAFITVVLVFWILLPPAMPRRGEKLPVLICEALWLQDGGAKLGAANVTYLLAREHVDSMCRGNTFPLDGHIKRILREMALAKWVSICWDRDRFVQAEGLRSWALGQTPRAFHPLFCIALRAVAEAILHHDSVQTASIAP